MTEANGMNLNDWAMALYQEHGKLTPEIVMVAARPEDSPAHQFVFGLSVEEAAEDHYRERAHRLIQMVRVVREVRPDEPPRRIRVFHQVVDDGERSYIDLDRLAARPDLFVQARAAAEARMRDAEQAVANLDVILAAKPGKNGKRSAKALAAVREARQQLAAVETD